ncbi:uncharacterized protein BX664DRAFT_194586 [Halteromyces radiatus]|uniref:uncharacterized protein n=1 Tax=Halteromyces radiatus TaxID=101107 RepID=UPI0022210EB6|nr:uncharacterized protein BX664DRAFT_194586 [Halteromyces radiatus]KAI8081471.1 hypothetical protein BX664DRAFT_194586 [Halteromyces radiatus]
MPLFFFFFFFFFTGIQKSSKNHPKIKVVAQFVVFDTTMPLFFFFFFFFCWHPKIIQKSKLSHKSIYICRKTVTHMRVLEIICVHHENGWRVPENHLACIKKPFGVR